MALVSVVLATAALYWAQAVLVPIALAVLLAFLLAPLVTALERRRVHTVAAVIVVVALAFSAIGGLGWIVGLQVASFAQELPRYRGNISDKIADLRGVKKGTAIEKIQQVAEEVTDEMQTSDRKRGNSARPVPVTVHTPSLLFSRLPTLMHALAAGGFVVVLVIFILLRRVDLRNRFIRVFGYQNLEITVRALDEADERVTRYLVRQSIINASFGAAIGLGLLLIGVPYAALWGVLGAALRFIPYIGSWIAVLAPVLISLAVFPGWLQPLLVVGLIVGLELVIYVGIEPWFYGQGAGLSEVALLIALAFWTWLWGPVGLLLATPMTVCLVVFGKYVPGLEPVAILLGEEPPMRSAPPPLGSTPREGSARNDADGTREADGTRIVERLSPRPSC